MGKQAMGNIAYNQASPFMPFISFTLRQIVLLSSFGVIRYIVAYYAISGLALVM